LWLHLDLHPEPSVTIEQRSRSFSQALAPDFVHHHAMQRLPKTRYQNWPTETGAEISVFVLQFETRRQGQTSETSRICTLFKPWLKLLLKQAPGWLSWEDSN